MTDRECQINRATSETQIEVGLNLDAKTSKRDIQTGVGFFDHMLDHIGKHGRFELKVLAKGDLHIDDHHTVEDVGIVLGQALIEALGDKRGIERYGFASIPMDDALARVTIDLSGRPALVFKVTYADGTPVGTKIGSFDTQLVREFFQAMTNQGQMNCHIEVPYGDNDHHIVEAIFKAFGRALYAATRKVNDEIPSTKGTLVD